MFSKIDIKPTLLPWLFHALTSLASSALGAILPSKATSSSTHEADSSRASCSGPVGAADEGTSQHDESDLGEATGGVEVASPSQASCV